MDEGYTYSGYVEVKPEDIGECDKAPWQLMYDSWLSRLEPAEKEIVVRECKYILEVIEKLEKEKENGKDY